VKTLYEQDAGDKKLKICKTCKAALKHGKKTITVAASTEAPATGAEGAAETKEA
jgi:hypothetical protein